MKLLFFVLSFCCVFGQSTYWTKEKKKEIDVLDYSASYYFVAIFKNPITIKAINEFEAKNKYEAIARADDTNRSTKEKLNMFVFKDLLFKDKSKNKRAFETKIEGNTISLCYKIEKKDFNEKRKSKFFVDIWPIQRNKTDLDFIRTIEKRMIELEFVATVQHELYQKVYSYTRAIFRRLVELEKENAKLKEEIRKLKEK